VVSSKNQFEGVSLSLIIDPVLSAQYREQLPEILSGQDNIVAVIGGSGLDSFAGAKFVQQIKVLTPLSDLPVQVDVLKLAQENVPAIHFLFLPRHGANHKLAPHKINYRANIWALKALGVHSIIAVNAVGGVRKDLEPGSLVLVDQVIDYSHGRDATFFDGEFAPLDHIDFTEPASSSLNLALQSSSKILKKMACYGCTPGPRLETAAEVKRMQRDGVDVIGMTLMPEAALAREADIDYASVCMVVNWGAGLTPGVITLDEIYQQLNGCTSAVISLIQKVLPLLFTKTGKSST